MKQALYRRMPIEGLEPAGLNPRRIAPEAAASLERSMDRFGMVQPVVWNQRSGRVVGGHQRLSILRREGATEVDVAVVDLSEADEKALNVVLNSAHVAGTFTDELQGMLKEIRDADAALFDDLDLDAVLDTEIDRDPLRVEGGGSPLLSSRLFVLTPEQEYVVEKALNRVREHGVFRPEANSNDNGNELASALAYFLTWSDGVLGYEQNS